MLLPTELNEAVVDFIEDAATLRSTSLVCKEWLTRSRFNLFRSVELCLPDHLEHFVALLSQAPQIAPFVKELCISENSVVALLRPALSIIARFPTILSPLVRPRRLVVQDQLWSVTRYDPDYHFGLSHLSSITSLELCNVTFPSVADMSIVLRALGRLQFLDARCVECDRNLDATTLAAIGCELPFLTSLRLECVSPAIVDWLLQYNSLPSLRDTILPLDISPARGSQGLGALWDNAGSTLEDVTLNVYESKGTPRLPVPTSVFQKQLDISPCTALRRLHFDFRREREPLVRDWRREREPLLRDWSWLRYLLSHVTAHNLRTIVFSFQSSSHALMQLRASSGELDRALVEASFMSSLETLRFAFDRRCARNVDGDGDEDEDKDVEALLDAFSALRAKGVLEVA